VKSVIPKMRSNGRAWELLALLFIARWASAADSLAYAPPFSLSPGGLYAAASVVPPRGDAGVNIIEADERFVFEADGSLRATSYVVYKILSPAAVSGAWSAVAAPWSPWRQDKPVIRARVVSADGSEHKLDHATIVDSSASSIDPRMFGDLRLMRAPLPALSTGVVVEREFRWSSGRHFPLRE